MAQERRLTPGYVVIYPNREKVASHVVKAIVVLLLLVSVALMLAVTLGGWSELQGLKPLDLIWCAAYLAVAFFIATRWARGLLPIAAGLAILLLMVTIIAALGADGTSWFDRSNFGYAAAKSIFGGNGLSADTLGTLVSILVPVQVLLILFAMRGFQQAWNVELEVPKEEADRRRSGGGQRPPESTSPATA